MVPLRPVDRGEQLDNLAALAAVDGGRPALDDGVEEVGDLPAAWNQVITSCSAANARSSACQRARTGRSRRSTT